VKPIGTPEYGDGAKTSRGAARPRRFFGGDHDVCFGRGNIDHVVVGPGGIFTVETKSRGGKISPDRLEPKMVGQAYAEKKKLEEITLMEVQALLVFSRAYIVGPVPVWRRGVAILPARMLATLLTTTAGDVGRASRRDPPTPGSRGRASDVLDGAQTLENLKS
jgi:hypothetical protein